MTKLDTPSKKALDWMISARSRINPSLRELFEIHQTYKSTIDQHDILHQISGTLTGVAFCLWRSSFLIYRVTKKERRKIDIIGSQERLLMYLVRDNAVGFTQDRATRDWQSGYYINSAIERINRLIPEIHSNMNKMDIKLHGGSHRELHKDWNLVMDRLEHFSVDFKFRCEELAT